MAKQNHRPGSYVKGRGAQRNPHNRFASRQMVACADGWESGEQALDDESPNRGQNTEVFIDHSRTIVSSNRSPDVPFDQSINPYKGCEHGCIYCFARPTHEYLDLSLGQDFETRLFYKPNAIELLEKYLGRAGYRCRPIALGINTDAYQPLEKEMQLTRRLLETLLQYRHPVSLVTKGSLILRDLDLLSELARHDLVSVMISVTSLDKRLKTLMEPRAAAPATRLRIIRELSAHNVPTGVLFAPIIPFINDGELEAVISAAAEQGAGSAGYVMLRLPYQLKALFEDWLALHFPERRDRILNRLRELGGGKLYHGEFGDRMRGQGAFADLIRQRFAVAVRRNGLSERAQPQLRTDLFQVPGSGQQQSLDL